ncbi:MAG: hypothetical protein WCX63_06590 [Methanoregula sp.]
MEISITDHQDVAIPDAIASGMAGTGQGNKIITGPAPFHENRKKPDWSRVRVPARHFSTVKCRVLTVKRECRTGRAVTYREENS